MTERATQRPQPFVKPSYWSDAPPPQPQPDAAKAAAELGADPDGLSPTRYGDWVKNGIAVDF